MNKVMVFGTFDIFHQGHKSFLKQAKTYGEYLIVVLARDKTVLSLKKYKTENSEQYRMKAIDKSGLVDEVILGSELDQNDKNNKQFEVIKKYKPNIICLGYDQTFFVDELRDNIKNIEIFKMKAYKPEIYKSSKLKIK